MAVQAQYPANFMLQGRGEMENNNKEMEANFQPPFLEQSLVFFPNNEGNVNMMTRERESMIVSPQQQNTSVFSMQAPQRVFTPSLPGLSQLQPSTSLRLAFQDQNQCPNQRRRTDSILSPFPQDLVREINRQKLEMDQFITAQAEQLRREILAKQQHHYGLFLATVKKYFRDKLREKEAEVQLAARRLAELQDRLTHLRTESMAWQAKIVSQQTEAASLQAQLQQAVAAAALAGGECSAEDACSGNFEPDRSDNPNRLCWICQTRAASVVLLPCRHLCVCTACDSVTLGCPACGSLRTGSLEVFFS